MMNIKHSFTIILLFLCVPFTALADITWEVYLQSSPTPILSKTVRVGEEFELSSGEFANVPSESRALLDAFDGVTLLLNQCPLYGNVVFQMRLNAQGNNFLNVRRVPLFLNITFQAFSNGTEQPSVSFSKSQPFIMKFPHNNGIVYLLGRAGLNYNDDFIMVYDSGGSFDIQGISSSRSNNGIIVTMDHLSTIVGGFGDTLGYPANNRIDTWSKIKLLFR